MFYFNLNKKTSISKIGIGSLKNFGEKIDRRNSQKIILNFFDQGVNFIDSSVNYANGNCEKVIGDILKKNNLRSSFFIASKIFFSTNKNIKDGLNLKNIKFSMQEIRKNYKTDFIDCIQCHRFDPNQSLYELVDVFEDYIKRGEIRYWGVTNWPNDKIKKVQQICKMKKNFVFNQLPLNIFYKKNIKSLLMLKKNKFRNIVYGVLSKGILSNNFVLNKKTSGIKKNINYTQKNVLKIKNLFNICKKFDYTLEEFIYSLINSQKYVDITLCGVSSLKYFNTLNFKKVFNEKKFHEDFKEMKKYEEIKNIL